MIYELAIVVDQGTHYGVQGVTKSSLDKLANRDEKFLKLSYVAYKQINDAIMNGQLVRISKTLQTDEVLPGEIQIINNDKDSLEYIREAAFIKVKALVTPEMTKESGFTLYNFIMRNNDLASRGFFITDDNREEQYLKVIETGDEDLIDKLEDFLIHKDKMERAASMMNRLDKFKEDVNKLHDVESINQLVDTFLNNFYN